MEHMIISERLQIRRIVSDDWKTMKEIWEDQANSPYVMYDKLHDTEEQEVKNRIARWAARADGKEHIFYAVCLKDHRMIGFISCNLQGEAYDIGYGFKKEFQGNGYARESLKAVTLRIAAYSVNKITAGTALKNEPSVRLLRSVGFQLKDREQVSFYKDANHNPIYFEGGRYELQI